MLWRKRLFVFILLLFVIKLILESFWDFARNDWVSAFIELFVGCIDLLLLSLHISVVRRGAMLFSENLIDLSAV